MLKLEKVAKTLELNVILRNKPALLTRTFFIAFGYALACHSFAFLLFHISPFKISYEPSLIPPVYVASDFFSDPNQHISVHFDENSYVPDYLAVPRSMSVVLPAMRQQAEVAPKVALKSINALAHPFALENKIAVEPMINIFKDIKPTEAFSAIALGGLAERKLIVESSKTKELLQQFAVRNPSLVSAGPYKVVFSVMVERDKGDIFWWEPHNAKNENLDSSIVWLAVGLLQNLRFEKGPVKEIGSGDIEMTLVF